jgi:hypothetical protein
MCAAIGITCGVVGSTILHKIQGLKDKPAARLGEPSYEAPVLLKSTDHNTTPQMRVGFIEAMNGRILEVSTQIPHPGMSNHYDWKTEMYIVHEDQKLSEAIAVVMLMKGLEK